MPRTIAVGQVNSFMQRPWPPVLPPDDEEPSPVEVPSSTRPVLSEVESSPVVVPSEVVVDVEEVPLIPVVGSPPVDPPSPVESPVVLVVVLLELAREGSSVGHPARTIAIIQRQRFPTIYPRYHRSIAIR
jgi:hypothetical protein